MHLRSLFIELSSTCNLSCPGCIRSVIRGDGHMSERSLAKTFAVFDNPQNSVDYIYLHLFGESGLHPDLFNVIERAAQIGAKVCLNSNGAVLHRADRDRLLSSPLWCFTLGLDGATAETIERYRVGQNGDRLLNESLPWLAKNVRHKPLVVEWQFVVMRHNEHEIEQARAIAESHGFRFVLKTASLEMGGTMGAELLPNAFKLSRYNYPSNGCPFVANTLAIASDGSILPCCCDPKRELVIGHIDSGLEAAWDGHARAMLVESLESDRPVGPCVGCSAGRRRYPR